MSISNYLELELLDHVVGGTTNRIWTPPATIYVQLHTGNPGEDCTLAVSAETTRQPLTGHTQWGTAAAGAVSSSATVEWTNWSAGTETIQQISLWDAATGGNPLWYGALTTNRTVNNGDTLRFASGNITLTLD